MKLNPNHLNPKKNRSLINHKRIKLNKLNPILRSNPKFLSNKKIHKKNPSKTPKKNKLRTKRMKQNQRNLFLWMIRRPMMIPITSMAL